jgi:hypothetical protein
MPSLVSFTTSALNPEGEMALLDLQGMTEPEARGFPVPSAMSLRLCFTQLSQLSVVLCF